MKRYQIALCVLTWQVGVSCNAPQKEQKETNEKSQLEEEHELFRAGYADSVNNGYIDEDSFTGSARRMTKASIDDIEISINYGSPGKRGRVIWNGLVSYDQVWVSGSHWATAVSFSKDVQIAGTEVKAGTYGFFTIPGREEWILILNKLYDMHLAEQYEETNDILRLKVQPLSLNNTVQRLTYSIEEVAEDSGKIVLEWDQVRLEMPFSKP